MDKFILFDMNPIGTLHVYSIRSQFSMEPINNYYWADAGSPQGHGPFDSLWACMEHHKALVRGFQAPHNVHSIRPNSLIRVDFQTRKRL